MALATLAALLLLAAPTVVADAAPAAVPGSGIGVRLVDVPTSAVRDPRARAYIVDHVKPGSSFQRRIEVVNNGEEPARVAVYAAAADVTQGGFVTSGGRTANDLSSWVQATPDALELSGGGRAYVNVSVSVPAMASRGERYGVVWAETQTAPTKGGVTQLSRAGIRMYLSVGPGGAPRTDFTIDSLAAARDEKGVPLLRASVRNTGERALDLSGALTLGEGPAGLSAGPFAVPAGTTLGLGTTATVLVPLDARLPDGPWKVTVTLSSGTTKRSVAATLTFPAAPGTGPAVVTAPDGVPWWPFVALAAVLLAAVVLLLRARRSRRPEVKRG